MKIDCPAATRDSHLDTAPPKPRRVKVEDLLAGGREVIIEHRNEEYRLRLTSNAKLILTK